MIKIAVILANDMKDYQIVNPLYIWNKLGMTVHLVSVEKKNSVLLESGFKLYCTDTIEKVNLSQYNAIYIPGGEGVKQLNFTTWPTKKEDIISKFCSSLEKFLKSDEKILLFTSDSVGVLETLRIVKNTDLTKTVNPDQKTTMLVKSNNILVYDGYSVVNDFIVESTKMLEDKENKQNGEKSKELEKKVLALMEN